MKFDLTTVRALWNDHLKGCKSCRKVDEDDSKTINHVCAVGAPILKDILELNARPALAAKRKKENAFYRQMLGKEYCSAAKMKKLMRYKEPDDVA